MAVVFSSMPRSIDAKNLSHVRCVVVLLAKNSGLPKGFPKTTLILNRYLCYEEVSSHSVLCSCGAYSISQRIIHCSPALSFQDGRLQSGKLAGTKALGNFTENRG